MTQNPLTTSRRRASARNSNFNNSDDTKNFSSNSSNDSSFSSDTLPSRIPIKSPARRASTSAAATTNTAAADIGGMTVAYSPVRSNIVSNVFNANNGTEFNSSPSDYARKLLDLKHAMELLKTPPAPQITTNSSVHNVFSSGHNQVSYNHNSAYSYTPIKSSTLAHQIRPSFASSIEESSEMSMELTDDSSTINTSTNNDTSLLEAYHNDDSVSRVMRRNELFSSPTPNFSSPYLSSDELKKRLVATREAFQQSLESQKRRLRANVFDDDDSSSFLFDSDLSTESLKSTRNQIDKIKKEINELIESDIEEIERLNNSETEVNLLNTPLSDSYFATFFKYFVIFSISSVIFTYLIQSYTPFLKAKYFDILEFIQTGNLLDKLEEFLNFLLQDN